MASVFPPAANFWVAATLSLASAAVLVAVTAGTLWQTSDYARAVRNAKAQPVPFSHEHHVSALGIDCRYCHETVERAASAGMPQTYTCMSCHSQVWTTAKVLEPLRQSLAQNTPLTWSRITDLPDYAYFDHSIHIAKGVGCASCHGNVAAMPLTWKAKTLTMAFCLDCHRNPAPNLVPRENIFDTQSHPRRHDPALAQRLLAHYQIGHRNLTDCSICHR